LNPKATVLISGVFWIYICKLKKRTMAKKELKPLTAEKNIE
jgi:hypothetical protein